jgi:hypothetical protein
MSDKELSMIRLNPFDICTVATNACDFAAIDARQLDKVDGSAEQIVAIPLQK